MFYEAVDPLGGLCWQCAFLSCVHQFGTSSERAAAWARHFLGICDVMHLAVCGRADYLWTCMEARPQEHHACTAHVKGDISTATSI